MAGARQSVVLLVATMATVLFGMSSAATFTVGGNTGWTIPSTTSFYSTWASQQTFQVGDELVFNFATGHTVAPVAKAAYDACSTSNPLSPAVTTSPARMNLTTAAPTTSSVPYSATVPRARSSPSSSLAHLQRPPLSPAQGPPPPHLRPLPLGPPPAGHQPHRPPPLQPQRLPLLPPPHLRNPSPEPPLRQAPKPPLRQAPQPPLRQAPQPTLRQPLPMDPVLPSRQLETSPPPPPPVLAC